MFATNVRIDRSSTTPSLLQTFVNVFTGFFNLHNTLLSMFNPYNVYTMVVRSTRRMVRACTAL
ncbi:MAG: hypothetical protein HY985_08760 [Magnetospirillum sp.]|nr:hypothetical protein [Magnetospirillum sp.]